MATVDTYDFCALRGDSWEGLTVQLTQDGTPIDLSSCTIGASWALTLNTGTPVVTRDSSTGGGIRITDPLNGIFVIDPFIFTHTGTYKYDVQVTFPDTTVKTYLKGLTKVTQDIHP